jgi:formamidase
VECLDVTGGHIQNNDCADDVRDIDLTHVHYLSGPFEIEGTEPGDVLVVEIWTCSRFKTGSGDSLPCSIRRMEGGF